MYLIWQNNKIKIATVFLKIKNNTKHLSSDQNVNKHLAEILVDSKEGSDSDLIIIIIIFIIFFYLYIYGTVCVICVENINPLSDISLQEQYKFCYEVALEYLNPA